MIKSIPFIKPYSSVLVTRARLALAGIVLVALTLTLIGLDWGLPNSERTAFYPRDVQWYEAPKYSRDLYVQTPYEPYHPDEGFILDAISNMNPAALDFNPHFFNYPTLFIYVTAGVLKGAEILDLVTLVNDKQFYLDYPNEMGRVYLIGRIIALTTATIGVVLLYATVNTLYRNRSLALVAALILAITPLWVRNAHFMLVNIPATMLMVAAALCAARAIQTTANPTRNLWLSAIFAGLATSTKYTAGAILLLTFFALWRRSRLQRDIIKQSAIIIGLSGFAFLAGTPYALVSRERFLAGLFFESGTKLGWPSPRLLLEQLLLGQGNWLFILTFIGFILLVRHLWMWQAQFVLLFLVAGLAQRLISHADVIRYLIPALPALAICAGLTITRLYERVSQHRASILVGLLLLPTVGYSLNIVSILNGRDVRTEVAQFVEDQIEVGTTIGVNYGITFDMPPINATKYTILDTDGLPHSDYPPVLILATETYLYWDGSPPADYKQITFSQHPHSLWTWPLTHRAHDWSFTFLDVDLFHASDFIFVSD